MTTIALEEDPSKVLQDPVYELTAEEEEAAAEWRAKEAKAAEWRAKVFALAASEGIKLTPDDIPF